MARAEPPLPGARRLASSLHDRVQPFADVLVRELILGRVPDVAEPAPPTLPPPFPLDDALAMLGEPEKVDGHAVSVLSQHERGEPRVVWLARQGLQTERIGVCARTYSQSAR